MEFQSARPKLEEGDVVQITSDRWYVWTEEHDESGEYREYFREMTVEEMLEYSK